MDTAVLGRFGEEQAACYLRRRGYKVLERNYRCRSGEIDLIVSKGEYVVFVEVKLRKNADFANAREFVTRAKQQRVITAASLWLGEHACERPVRFDVVEVYAPHGPLGHVEIDHLEDAFS